MWEWLLSRISLQCDRHDIAVILNATHIKVHQDATRHPAKTPSTKAWQDQAADACEPGRPAPVHGVGFR
jgi:hypothetical protein